MWGNGDGGPPMVQIWHAYLHDTQERLTLLSSGDREHVERAAWEWLNKNEPDSEANLVISKVEESIDAGDFLMRGLKVDRCNPRTGHHSMPHVGCIMR